MSWSVLLFCWLIAPGEAPGTLMDGKLLGHVKSVADTTEIPGTPEVIERRKYSPDGCMAEYAISTGYEPAKIFISACDGRGNKTEEREYLQHDNSIRSVTIYKHDNGGRLTEEQKQDGNGHIKYTLTYTYDQAGQKTERKLMEDGKLSSQHFYQYDDAGNLERDSSIEGETKTCDYFRYDAKGRIVEHVSNYYTKNSFSSVKEASMRDAKGNEIEMLYTDTDTSRNYKRVTIYQDTLPVEIREYKSAGLSSFRTFAYDKKGRVIETTYHSYLDSQPVSEKNTYKWNEHGDQTEEAGYKPDGNLSYQLNYEYIYDTMGNMIRKSRIKDAVRTVLTRRSIEYY